MALINTDVKTKGVDSTESSENALELARILAKETGAVVSISGPKDFITDGHQVISIHNHIPLMPKVTGMGCSASVLTGAFASSCGDNMEGAASAMAIMAVAGEMAIMSASGPGSFQMQFLDALYNMNDTDIAKHLSL
jgi:hydroxyethylthiazole kinase